MRSPTLIMPGSDGTNHFFVCSLAGDGYTTSTLSLFRTVCRRDPAPRHGAQASGSSRKCLNESTSPIRFALLLALTPGMIWLTGLHGADTNPPKDSVKPEPGKVAPRPAPPPAKPKLLPGLVTSGLDYLARQQQPNGGWGPGDGRDALYGQPGAAPAKKGGPKDKGAPKDNGQVLTDLANTSIAGLAFLRWATSRARAPTTHGT